MTVKQFEAEFAKYPLPEGTPNARAAMMWFIAWQRADELMEENHRALAHHILDGIKPLKLSDVKDWLDSYYSDKPGDEDDRLREEVKTWMFGEPS